MAKRGTKKLGVRWCSLALLVSACAVEAYVYKPKREATDDPGSAGAGGETLPPPAGTVGRSSTPAAPRRRIVIDETEADNPAGLSPEDVERLAEGGPAGATQWLYPYDGTVFPRSTAAPLVMWQSDAPPDVVYLRIESTWFEYKGVLRPSLGNALFIPANSLATLRRLQTSVQDGASGMQEGRQLAIPQHVWRAATEQSLGKGDPFKLELTIRVNGEVRGPVEAQITIAQAAVKGSIYYNSCLSSVPTPNQLTSGAGSVIMRIPPGENAELLNATTGTQCIGCHTVSADGSRVVAQRLPTSEPAASTGSAEPSTSRTYALSYQLGPDGRADSASPQPIGQLPAANSGMLAPWGGFGAVYPDGSKYLSTSNRLPLHFSLAMRPATLYDTTTGAIVMDTGIPDSAAMPMFSPDGRFLAFIDAAFDRSFSLAVMDYDTTAHKASNYRVILSKDLSVTPRPGWPTFLPDNRALVFVKTPSLDFSGMSAGSSGTNLTRPGAALGRDPSDLYIADLATRKDTLLAKAMGFNTLEDADTETTYLRHGADELHRNYYPTVAPTAAGGYFWIFFDSVRHYGSLGLMRVLWGAAIDIRPDGNYALDPSHPPFYVPGQEFSVTSHFRAFAALDRCKEERAQCQTGIDCCSGFCTGVDTAVANPVGTCAARPAAPCANRDEKCSPEIGCCESNNQCINGFCAFVELL